MRRERCQPRPFQQGGQGARSHEQKAEDEKALYSRLNIQGLLSKVLLRPGAPIKDFHLVTVEDEMPPRKRLRSEAPATEVKREKAAQDMLRTAVAQALSHGSNEVILQEVAVPWAVVKLPSGALLPPQSGGSGNLATQKIDITVSSNDLLPLPDDEVKAPTGTEPALMKEAVALEVIDAYHLENTTFQ